MVAVEVEVEVEVCTLQSSPAALGSLVTQVRVVMFLWSTFRIPLEYKLKYVSMSMHSHTASFGRKRLFSSVPAHAAAVRTLQSW